MTKLLTKDDILNADDLPSEVVDVPEWGGHVKVRTMSGSERDAFEASLIESQGKKKSKDDLMSNIRARFASLVLVDDDGKRLFTAKDIA